AERVLVPAAAPAPEHVPLALHDALPTCRWCSGAAMPFTQRRRLATGQFPLQVLDDPHRAGIHLIEERQVDTGVVTHLDQRHHARSEEHTSELQSRENLVCRLLLEKKNQT